MYLPVMMYLPPSDERLSGVILRCLFPLCLYKFFSNQLHVSKFVINLNHVVKLYSVYHFDTVGNFLELFIAQTLESLIIGCVDADKWRSLDLTNKRLVSIS